MSKVKGEITDYGFNFGSIEVTRTCSHFNGVAIISIKTPKSSFSVRATKTGVVRVFDGEGNECVMERKGS
jgi:hypothetical protein